MTGKIQSGQSANERSESWLPAGGNSAVHVCALAQEIFQTPSRVVIIREGTQVMRQIYMNRGHRDDLYPTYSGDSVGKWEGNTLVVDTIGFNDKTWIDSSGLPHTEAMHVVERIHRVDHDTLADDVTVEDAMAYTKPFTLQQTYKLKPGWEIHELVCTANNKYTYHANSGTK